jgi:hypothetical protein
MAYIGVRVPDWHAKHSHPHTLKEINMSAINPSKVFRPWNTDSVGVIVHETAAAVTVAYEHDPAREHVISRRDLPAIGRFVTR